MIILLPERTWQIPCSPKDPETVRPQHISHPCPPRSLSRWPPLWCERARCCCCCRQPEPVPLWWGWGGGIASRLGAHCSDRCRGTVPQESQSPEWIPISIKKHMKTVQTKRIVMQMKNLVDRNRNHQKSYSFTINMFCHSTVFYTNSTGLQDFLNINNDYWLWNFSVRKKVYFMLRAKVIDQITSKLKSSMSAFPKNWPVKVLSGRCLSVWGPSPPRFLLGGKVIFRIWSNTQCITPVYALHTTQSPPPPPVTHCIDCTNPYLFTQGGGGRWSGEKVEGQ